MHKPGFYGDLRQCAHLSTGGELVMDARDRDVAHASCLQPPTAWAAALRHPRAAAHQQCWHVLAMLLVKLEESGQLPSGKACKALHLAQTLQVRARAQPWLERGRKCKLSCVYFCVQGCMHADWWA